LALYIFAEDRKEQNRVLDRTQSGGVTVNGTLASHCAGRLAIWRRRRKRHGLLITVALASIASLTPARFSSTGFFNAADWLAPPYGKARQAVVAVPDALAFRYW
jgi:hypothetical protein